MTASFEIGRAAGSDAAALAGFAARLFRSTYSADTLESDLDAYIDKAFSTESQSAEIADPSAAVFLAKADGAIVGYVHLIVALAEQCAARLSRIYIDADWRGRGLANDLLNAVIGECRQRGVTRIELTVFERNARAIAFYTKVGFAVTGTTTFTVGADVQRDMVMVMDVAARTDDRAV
ncbi:GNAT family N-acetyltransferase [Rhizobium sp. Root1220]|uniref:GNAT family N-acetyltransferase n=1 Tax=Rhizobium sp. Root1220 TaxID=1736432 RepID=UPI0006FEC948|nr:GNAT family N-acetyltransferase [Rhizobium sp. Root1220]KQV68089.1 acetyltransferase [Rhizobium sp. Root1220]